ncbi:MAG TPA: acetyl-CoA synthetase [Ruminococcaceae bacterium]|nr:acetyl-CoA synthetase [Oscillospiraceae bacterium]
MRNINLRYITETYDSDGIIQKIDMTSPEYFNFGYDIVDDIAVNDPNRRALVWCNDADEEKTFTFADIKYYSDKTANFLRANGIGKGDMVLVVLKRHYQFWFTAVALSKLGAVMIPATFMVKKHDVEYRINVSGAKAAIVTADGDVAEQFDACEANCPTLKTKVIVNGQRDGWLDFNAEIEKASDELERIYTKSSDPMLSYFSSGTSGYPKMIMHACDYPIGHIQTAKHWQCVVPDGLHLTIADSGWAKCAWGKIFGQWIMEAGLFVYDFDKFDPGKILPKIEKYKITTLCCPPTMFRFFLNHGIEQYDLSSLTHTNIAGEALSPDVYNTWYQATGLKLYEGFGQSESTPIVCNVKGMEPKPGSMGKPSPQYTVDIIDADGVSCETGFTGEIVVKYDPENRPQGLLTGYYGDEEKTKDAIHDGWYHTGDTAWRDEDGYYWYVGRNDDMIKSSGYRIGPFEIESVLLEHPSVLECAVTSVPDPVRGQAVKATIVLRNGYVGSEALTKELQTFVKKETAPYKYPRVIEYVDALPKTASGKIRRVEIRANDMKKWRENQ